MNENILAQITDIILSQLSCPAESCTMPEDAEHFGWRLLRWDADEALTQQQQSDMLAIIYEYMRPVGVAQGHFTEDGTQLYILACLTQFRARAHRETAMWLCAHGILEGCANILEQEGVLSISDEFAQPGQWPQMQPTMLELSDWWRTASPIDSSVARTHRTKLQTIMKRRQYNAFCGYVTRCLRTEREVNRMCFAFVPLMIEAVWGQHPGLGLREVTISLSLPTMARRPQEALLTWLKALIGHLQACPVSPASTPLERVIDSIRSNCALPYTQANLSRSLGLTPAYFCRLFHEKTGMHFSTFLTTTRMENAKELLVENPMMSLQEISSACGYPNKNYFCQVFKKHVGLSPSEYCQHNAKENT